MSDAGQSPDILAAIKALGDIFIGRLPGALITMGESLRLSDENHQNPDPWNALYRQLHTIAGSSGSFGYDELGTRARQLEIRINAQLKSGEFANPQTRQGLITELRALMQWIDTNYVTKT